MVRVGIIGLGMMGRTHYEAYEKLPGVRVVAIADESPQRAAGDLSGTAGNVLEGGLSKLPMDRIKGFTDYRELIKLADLDAIDVCVPTPHHLQVALDAIATGKHVLCEKPLARTADDAQKIADAAGKAKGLFMPAMCMRFWPEWAWLKKVIDQKTYGKVLSASFRRVASMPSGWYKDGKLSGGAVLDLHIHDTDFVHFLFGKPTGVASRGYTKTTGQIDHVSTQYLYKDIPHVQAEGAWCMADGFGFNMQYTVNFETATAVYDLKQAQNPMVYQNGQGTAIECAKETGYEGELRYFTDCCAKGLKPTVVTANDAVNSIRIVEAEVRSIAAGGKIVEL